MILNNINNLSIVDVFVSKYEETIIDKYPQIENWSITICLDTQISGWLKALDDDENSPYTNNYLAKKIFKHVDAFNKCGFLAEEEMAMIGHELGHINAWILKPEQQDSLQKEYQADDFSISLGLANEMKSALQKMIKAGICPDRNDEMQKRIDRINEMQLPSQTTSSF